MLLNYCVVMLLLTVSTAVVLGSDKITKKYNADGNRLIKRLHGSKDAKVFLHGCDAEPYINLSANETTASGWLELQKSSEYVFAIFTLQQVSLILTNARDPNCIENEMSFNITLGLHKNSMARLDMGFDHKSVFEKRVPLLPTIPYYVNISITDRNISVYEARTGASEPFLFYEFNLTSTFINATSDKYLVKFQHSLPIFAHYDCCEACTPWIYTRISGCSKYPAITASTESETTFDLKSLLDNSALNRTGNFLFNQTILVNHDGSLKFAAKIIFSESETVRGNRYEIVLSDTPKIFHFINSSLQHVETLTAGATLKRQYTSPFIVYITITRGGSVSLGHEEYPFLVYDARTHPVDVKYMTMVKFHEDFIRYDFFYNCTDVLRFNNERFGPEFDEDFFEDKLLSNDLNFRQIIEDVNATGYPIMWEYISKQFNATKYDVLHVFQDSYLIYEKSNQIVYKDRIDYEDYKTPANIMKSSQNSDKSNSGTKPTDYWELTKKAVVTGASFLFVGFLKFIFSLNCVKNLMKEVNVDDDQANVFRKSVSNVVDKNIASTFGLGIHE